MEQIQDVAGAVQVALQRVRGELGALERAVTVLTAAVHEKAAPIGPYAVVTGPIRTPLETANETPSWDELKQVLLGEVWLPEFGALLPPDEQG